MPPLIFKVNEKVVDVHRSHGVSLLIPAFRKPGRKMISSLKGYIPGLARLLETTPAALYERQRALVRAGLLAPEEGRGPGSGVRATAPSVALLVLSVLATESLSETDARVRALADMRPAGGEECPLTKARSFGQALAALLGRLAQAAKVNEIAVSRSVDRASFTYREGRQTKTSHFAGAAKTEPAISVSAALSHDVFLKIAKDVKDMVLESFNEQGAQ